MPNITGMDLAQATEELKTAGFAIGEVRVQDLSDPCCVFSQSPEAGTEVEAGSTVTLMVPTGTGTLPSVASLRVTEAYNRVVGQGFVNVPLVFDVCLVGTIHVDGAAYNTSDPATYTNTVFSRNALITFSRDEDAYACLLAG